MLGAIIGDIAGSTYEVDEVNALKEKRDNYLNRIKILDKNTPLFNSDSSYTDDSILTAAIAYSILNDGDYYKNLKEFGLREINLGLDKYGRSRFGKGFCDWVKGDYIGDSYGNGCAMRISPIANYYDSFKDIKSEMIKATYPSHNNKESYLMSNLVTSCIFLSKMQRSKTEIGEYIDIHFGNIVNFNLDDLQKKYKFTSRAINSVPQAVFCFLESRNFEDAIRKAISIGGDSDTIAAITGSIAEAYYGIDDELIKQVEPYLPEYIINIANDFYKAIGKKEPFKNELKDFFKEQNIYREDFFDFIKDKVKVFPSGSDLSWFGCFPIIEAEKVVDIRLLVPEIKNEQDLLVNIHEYMHALELFDELGTVYIERREEREAKAINLEKTYKKRKPI